MATLTATDDRLATGLALLDAGIPLTLLLDLALGPRSHELYRDEPADLSWVPARNQRLAG